MEGRFFSGEDPSRLGPRQSVQSPAIRGRAARAKVRQSSFFIVVQLIEMTAKAVAALREPPKDHYSSFVRGSSGVMTTEAINSEIPRQVTPLISTDGFKDWAGRAGVPAEGASAKRPSVLVRDCDSLSGFQY